MSSTNLVKKSLFTKPYLITTEELNQIGQDINLVGYDPQLNLTSDDTNVVLKYGIPCSPKLLNWVEPYQIAGIDYTLFYTEVNSGFSIGDRVFIINGTYDSNLLITDDKYKKGHDGYKVLFVDKCQVVLDIEFNGSLPSNEATEPSDDLDNLIKVYYIKDQNDFIHVNRQITTRGGDFDYRFNRNQNNIIFAPTQSYSVISGWGESLSLSDGPGFFIKDGTSSWVNITDEFMIGSYSIAATASANKILILNNSFNFVDVSFQENLVYSYETIGTFSSWQVNVKHENKNVPLISKSNFRNGTFNGNWNGGIYGSNDKRITWGSTSSIWNSGTLLNTIWERGIMESKQSQPQSYVSEFDNIVGTFGAPYQKSTNPDNDGYGYNFVINSEIRNAIINNANVSNSILGTSSTPYSIVEEHLRGTLTSQFIQNNFSDTLINKAYFESCGIQNANIQNSVVKNSRVENSRFYNVKSINTHYKKSLFKNSNYISDNSIRILHFEEIEFSQSGTASASHKVYKFYINKRSYEKFKFKDTFYIKGLKINSNTTSLLNFFDKKFKIGPYVEYTDVFSLSGGISGKQWYKRGFEYNCMLSTPKDNDYLSDVNRGANSLNSNIATNKDNFGYSIDIFVTLADIQTSPITLPSYTIPSVIIDYSDAYILNSDFESGIFENSNWNSGNHFNFSNDVNIKFGDDYDEQIWNLDGKFGYLSNRGEYYNMSLVGGTSSINVKTLYSVNDGQATDLYPGGIYPEVEKDYLAVDEVVFLNAVDYDTRGKVTGISFSGTGSNYRDVDDQGNPLGVGLRTAYTGEGTGLTVDITTSVIGQVTGFSLISEGSGYPNLGYNIYLTDSGVNGGNGLQFSMIAGNTNSIAIVPGTGQFGYSVGSTVSMQRVQQGGSSDDIILITSVNNGAVLSVNINYPGLGYSNGDILTIIQPSSDNNATFSVTGITGSLTRLPDQYKIVENQSRGNYQLQEIIAAGSTSILPGLTAGGKFSSYGANNRYGYLHKTKFYRSKILSGIFKKAYFNTSLIKNELYDVSDREFNNVEKIKSLLIVDSIFSKNSNILSRATYMNSFFVKNSDIWENGILYDSIWNGMTFNDGLVKSSTWLDGIFNNGLFYSSNTFDGNTTNFSYNENNINSFYKSGLTKTIIIPPGGGRPRSKLVYNNRLSWQKGTFINGEFYKSDWEGGNFNGGKFYYSKFYDGTINGGIIGDASITTGYTKVYNGIINYTTVENAELIAQTNLKLPSSSINSNGTIKWLNGIFNGGVFSTYNNLNLATWSGGIFNGGEFTGTAKWLNGVFNGGKFTSYYNSSQLILYSASDIKDNYSWEYGVFNGGEFGIGDLSILNNTSVVNNSSWFDGEFNGGYFKGKVWNNGVFTAGEFNGGGRTQSGYYAIGGTQSNNAKNFISSFGTSSINSYGIWKSGFVTDTKDRYVNRRIYNDSKRVSDTNINLKTVVLRDVLWMGGTFSHPSGTIQNSVWIDGTFENGTFRSSSFNPYVNRNIFLPTSSPTFSISDTCIWKNGTLIDSDFYISEWENGNFISGNGYGMIWKNGIVSYMNAYNIFWENGLWRNGNWYGSNFDLNPDGSITSDFEKQILFRGMNWPSRGITSSCHVWNIFLNESLSNINSFIESPATVIDYNSTIIVSESSNTPPVWLPNSTFGGTVSIPQPVVDPITIVWQDTQVSTDRIGSGTPPVSIVIGQTGSYQTTQSAVWEYSTDNINWDNTSQVGGGINDVISISTTFYVLSGDTFFRIKDGLLTSNVLKYTLTSLYNISFFGPNYLVPLGNPPYDGYNTLNGTITVNQAPVTITLKAFSGTGYLYTVPPPAGNAGFQYYVGTNTTGAVIINDPNGSAVVDPLTGSSYITNLVESIGLNYSTETTDELQITLNLDGVYDISLEGWFLYSNSSEPQPYNPGCGKVTLT